MAFASPVAVAQHEISRVMCLPSKHAGINGFTVVQHHRDGRIQDIDDYCQKKF
jgi:hypothetical protein